MYPSAFREFIDRTVMSFHVPLAWCWYFGIAFLIYYDLRLLREIPDMAFAFGLVASFLVLFYDHFFRIK